MFSNMGYTLKLTFPNQLKQHNIVLNRLIMFHVSCHCSSYTVVEMPKVLNITKEIEAVAFMLMLSVSNKVCDVWKQMEKAKHFYDL